MRECPIHEGRRIRGENQRDLVLPVGVLLEHARATGFRLSDRRATKRSRRPARVRSV